MSEKNLLKMGAECVGGDLILGHQTVGMYRDGSFLLTDAGRTVLDKLIEDAVVAEAIPATAKKPAAKKATAEKPAEEKPADDIDGLADLV